MTHLRRWVLAVGAALAIAAYPAVAFASADSDVTPVGPDAQQADSAVLNLSPFIVSSIIGFLIPVVTALLTKATTPAWVKALSTAALSAIAGAINVSLVDGGGAVISQSTVVSAMLTFGAAIVSYVGWWKPTNTTSNPGGKLATVGVK